MSVHEQDRALGAVRRVRTAREQDSRIGLQQALAVSRERDQEAEQAQARLLGAPTFSAGTLADFRLHVLRMNGLAEAQRAAAGRAETSRAVAEEATRRWQHDRSHLRVVDLLLERRAEERAQERDRRDARELDDLAAQGWLRSGQATEGER